MRPTSWRARSEGLAEMEWLVTETEAVAPLVFFTVNFNQLPTCRLPLTVKVLFPAASEVRNIGRLARRKVVAAVALPAELEIESGKLEAGPLVGLSVFNFGIPGRTGRL